MSDLPDAPSWPRKDVSITDEAEDALNSIKRTAFFEGRGEAVEEAMDNFTLVGQGTGRIVVSGGSLPSGTVAKIAISQRGYKGNQEERFTRNNNATVSPYLPPILAYDSESNWIIMEKCEAPAPDAVDPLKAVLDEAGVSYDLVELAKTNVGFYNGSPCIIDWDTLFR